MRYTLAENAISSLSIAIENFKKIYYLSDNYSESLIDEYTKICIIFLENSIELMLKAILASEFPLSIYEAPESKIIRKAMLKVDDSHKLEDILISEGNFRTIKYIDTVQAYNSRFHNSEKVFNIFKYI